MFAHKYSQKDIQRVKKFFNRENIYKQLKTSVSFLIPHRSDVKLKLNIGGGSYTDGNSITVGLPEMFINASYEEIFTALRALVGHEAQHVNSSDFKAYVAYQEAMTDYFLKNYTKFNPMLLKNYVSKTSVSFGNGTEDGRIEKILGNNLPGYVKYLKFLNGSIWNAQPMKGNSELGDFLQSIVSFAVTGLNPKDFNKFYKGTDLETNLNKVKPIILEGIDATTCKQCLDLCKEMMYEVEDYLIYLFENQSKEDEEFLNNMPTDPEFTTSEERDYNTNPSSTPVHFQPKKKKKQEEDKKEETKESQEPQSGDGESGEEKGEKEESSKGNASSKEDGEEEKNEKGSEDNDKEDGGGEESSQDNEQKSGKGSSSDNDASDQEDSKPSGKEDKNDDDESEGSSAIPKGTPQNDEEEDEMDEEEIAEQLRDLTKDIEEDAKEKLQEKADKKKNKKELNEEDFKLTPEELQEFENKYRHDSYSKFYEEKGFPLAHQMPIEIKREGTRFRKEVERIFRNKEAYTLRGQRKGVLDVQNLYKVQAKEFNVFVKKGVPVQSDFVAYLLEDGSGSMRDEKKEFHSKRALSIMEEGLKGIIPFKISTFSVNWHRHSVVHHVVKDFNENNSNYNYSYNALMHRRATGGNKDGYSIRVATKELLKRPEKDRILIIFSDGLPSDYNGGYKEGMADVKNAIKEARKAGIFVVSIIFGSDDFRDYNMESYRYMYEKNIISCDPQNITNQLTRMLKKVISR